MNNMTYILNALLVYFITYNSTQEQNQLSSNNFEVFYCDFLEQIKDGAPSSISYPVDVMCFADLSKGDYLDSLHFHTNRNRIFSCRVIEELESDRRSFTHLENGDCLVEIGFAKWNEDISMDDEFGFHYYFKKGNGTWYLSRIDCVG
tara:strand:+ start:821 stop:1261 length:441 start_codon:yes stop_codon:yes gene_type:complete